MDNARMCAIGHAKSSDKGMYQRFLVMGLFAEQFHPVAEFLFIFRRDSVFSLAEFHFAQVNDSVGPFYDKVDLAASCGFLPVSLVEPCGNLSCYTTYAQCLTYLVNVHQAKQFKGQPLPRLNAVRSGMMLPPHIVERILVWLYVFQIKQGIEIGQFVDSVLALFAVVSELHDKVTTFKVVQHRRQAFAVNAR